jgi:glutamate-1-semialdehyde 2,1-aminomutase
VIAMAGTRAALAYELTEENYGKAIANTEQIMNGIKNIIAKNHLDWSLVNLGARFDIWFSEKPGMNAAEAFEIHDSDLYEYIFTALVNRGFIMSPYWNILASVSPYLNEEDCISFIGAFEEIIQSIIKF